MKKGKLSLQIGKNHLHNTDLNDMQKVSNKNNKKYFNKRTYTFRSFIKDISSLISYKINMKPKKDKISSLFSERIMMSVTAVNGCTICNWFHTKLALEIGMSPKEIADIGQLEFSNSEIPDYEKTALIFAQHYAETKGNPSIIALERVISFYGIEVTKSIILNIKLITIGNLYGNSVAAFESRIIHKSPSKNGSFLFELFIFILGGFLINKIMKLDTRKSNFE